MKIHIIGPSGAGKTYLAEKLSEKYNIPRYELDDLFWDNSAGDFNVKRPPEARDAILENILSIDGWIIEGVQYSWLGRSFEEADVIYLLDIPPALCRIRIVRRFIMRKLSGNGRKNETVRSVAALLKWTKRFYGVNLPEIKSELEKYGGKTFLLKSKKDIKGITER